jgi:hypothetical protein
MKLITSFVLIASATLVAAQAARADDAAPLASTNSLSESFSKAPDTRLDDQLFKANEVSVDVFGTLLTGQDALSHLSAERYRHDTTGGLGMGINYFFLRYVGVGADAYSEGIGGRFIDKSSGNLILRLPSERYHLAPYLYGGAGYQFDPNERALGQVGTGLEYRPIKHVGVFVDGRYVFPDACQNFAVARAGVRFSF